MGAAGAAIGAIAERRPGTLSVAVTECAGAGSLAVQADRPRSIASVGKLLLLTDIARRIEDGRLDDDTPVTIRDGDVCGGSGVLDRLRVRELVVADLCVLVAALSDNTATNALLGRTGIDALAALGDELGLAVTRVHDRIRNGRTPDLPPRFATGTAGELCRFMVLADRGELVSPPVSARVLDWMLANTDDSLVPAAFAHPEAGSGDEVAGWIRVRNKTGTDPGVRADVGLLEGRRRIAYAAIANWTVADAAAGDAGASEAADGDAAAEVDAIGALRDVGRVLGELAQA